jgi:hypothetical protein
MLDDRYRLVCACFDDALEMVEEMLKAGESYEYIDHVIEEQGLLTEDERAALWYVLYGMPGEAARRNPHKLPRTAQFLLP